MKYHPNMLIIIIKNNWCPAPQKIRPDAVAAPHVTNTRQKETCGKQSFPYGAVFP